MAIGGLGVSVSTDGEIWNWYAREGVDQFGIGYGNGVYVTLTGDCMSGTFEYSLNNGQTWIKARCATSYPIGIVYGNNRFVVSATAASSTLPRTGSIGMKRFPGLQCPSGTWYMPTVNSWR